MEHDLSSLALGLPLPLPAHTPGHLDESVPHAPRRTYSFSSGERELALRNALRYIPEEHHSALVGEFDSELSSYGHIYMYRFRPKHYPMKAHPIDLYPAKTIQAKAIQLMIMNNLDPEVAQFPHELVTYGGNGTVFNNWAQYHIVMQYLSQMTENQTLVLYSGHPLGLFPSSPGAPRVVITNGMVIPNYSSKLDYDRMAALSVSMYGQMTAGSYCYIGPQGIVHGTTLTLLGAARKYLGSGDLSGKVFVTSGLGGMSGAQAKAAVIAGAVGVVAEVNPAALDKRYKQGWIQEKTTTIDGCIDAIRRAVEEKRATSIAYLGNVVDLWVRLAEEDDVTVHLGSDQTSCHNPFNGGYYPYQVGFDEGNRLLEEDPSHFRKLVEETLCVHVEALNRLCSRGMKFWDYGNSFLLEASRAGADVMDPTGEAFRYPSYVEDIMGDIFSLGFGPFRWVCCSGRASDLCETDRLAKEITARFAAEAPAETRQQHADNHLWISQANDHKLVVGSQARILYSDCAGRTALALAFNEAVRDGRLCGPVVISRDHHDVSGTDSPYRETSNIRDGSSFTADMAVQNFVGDGMRGATWIALHNGGGTGWGEAINGGFGLVLDGSIDADRRVKDMLHWDVNNGVARRAWCGNENALWAIRKAQEVCPGLVVTMPHHAKKEMIDAHMTRK